MPDVKVYIRKENIAKWEALENKSDLINTILKELPVDSLSVQPGAEESDEETIEEQMAAAGYSFLSMSNGQAYGRDTQNHPVFFDVKYGRVIFPTATS